MKKLIAMLLAAVMVFALAACAPTTGNNESTAPSDSQPNDVKVMTHAEYAAAELNTEVVVETYVQTIESWWDGNCSIYAASEDGGYYIYDYACTEEEAAKLVAGTKIRVTGYKIDWNGMVEISEATVEILEGSYTATATDVTALLGTEELAGNMNALVSIKGLTVVASTDAEGNEAAFLYNWDGSGESGKNDLYFKVTDGTNVLSLTVNMYMVGTGADSDVYKAVEALKIGDTIDVEGFLYWYNNAPQPHLVSVTPAA